MQEYLEKSIDAFSEEITHKAHTPASSKLFEMSESELLSEKKSETFHHVVAKVLYMSKRVQVELSTAIVYICTRVSKNTIED